MEVKPVKRYSAPDYPTSEFLREHPELLRLVPKRWRNNRVVLTAIGAAAMLLVSVQCRSDRLSKIIGGKAQVAPLFVHGEGRGSFGCIAVNPPVFLSEEEALAVIKDEALKVGLAFDSTHFTIPNAQVPLTPAGSLWQEHEIKLEPVREQPLTLDGYDATRGVGFEYVSRTDFQSWRDSTSRRFSTAWTESMRETAERLRMGMQKSASRMTLGVFYDPMVGHREWIQSLTKEEKESFWNLCKSGSEADSTYFLYPRNPLAEDELRLQVRDFIAWLKAEGII